MIDAGKVGCAGYQVADAATAMITNFDRCSIWMRRLKGGQKVQKLETKHGGEVCRSWIFHDRLASG